jgi:hypothetical protein
MSTRKILTLASMTAMLVAPAAFGYGPLPDALDSPFYILGEKQDSGLGDLSPSYAAAEFQMKTAQNIGSMPEALDSPYYVLGESRDSGLGDLPTSYAAVEFQMQTAQNDYRGYRVIGESLDSGLGALPAGYTAAEFQTKHVVATR